MIGSVLREGTLSVSSAHCHVPIVRPYVMLSECSVNISWMNDCSFLISLAELHPLKNSL